MKKIKRKSGSSKGKSRYLSSKRQELEVSMPLVMAISAGITIAIYVFLVPFKESTLGILLYERGFTQYFAVAMAAMVFTITVLKSIRLQPEYSALSKLWIAEHIPLENPKAEEVVYLQERLAADGSLIATRCSRVLDCYIQTGDRSLATEFALDDSSFYQSASESSYSFPRILVWAIPLLGFIGTVMGISQSVTGFSGVLEDAADIEKIKEGIGTVTQGLAVAFDTTLLALVLSVLVMIPLVLLERYESRLLLGIDIFINDKLIPRLRDKNQDVNAESITRAVKGAIEQNFPNPENLIQPAQYYAEQAVNSLTSGFLSEIGKVQNVTSEVISQVSEVRQLASQDRQQFMEFFVQQQKVNQEAIAEIKEVVKEIRTKNSLMADNLNYQATEITRQLEQAAQTLESRIASLEQSASKISDLKDWQISLDQSLRSLEKTAKLATVLEGVKDNLGQLQPILQQLNKPRRITLVEQDNANNGIF